MMPPPLLRVARGRFQFTLTFVFFYVTWLCAMLAVVKGLLPWEEMSRDFRGGEPLSVERVRWFALAAFSVLLIGLFACSVKVIERLATAWRARRWRPAVARIRRNSRLDLAPGKRAEGFFQLEYEFEVDDQEFVGEGWLWMREGRFSGAVEVVRDQVGDSIDVIYDPRRPAWNALGANVHVVEHLFALGVISAIFIAVAFLTMLVLLG